jgi:hypothetical protein
VTDLVACCFINIFSFHVIRINKLIAVKLILKINLRSIKNKYFKIFCFVESINLKECKIVLRSVSRSITIFSH